VSLRIVFTPNAWQDYDGWLRRDMKTWRLPPATHYLDK
jgi:toxin YoeB